MFILEFEHTFIYNNKTYGIPYFKSNYDVDVNLLLNLQKRGELCQCHMMLCNLNEMCRYCLLHSANRSIKNEIHAKLLRETRLNEIND